MLLPRAPHRAVPSKISDGGSDLVCGAEPMAGPHITDLLSAGPRSMCRMQCARLCTYIAFKNTGRVTAAFKSKKPVGFSIKLTKK